MSENDGFSEEKLIEMWRKEQGTSYPEILTEIPLPDGSSGSSRKVDIIGVASEVTSSADSSDNLKSEDRLKSLLEHQRPLVVDAYEAKKHLGPRPIGQILVYSEMLPEIYKGLVIRRRGIIYARDTDDYSKDFAEKQGIDLNQCKGR